MEFLIYLDVCCLNRPFDEQVQERVRLESEAVLLILARCQRGEWRLLGSEAINAEIEQIPDEEKRQQVRFLAALASDEVQVTSEIESRAAILVNQGFSTFDALHIACAEVRNADVLLTTDDRLLRRALRQDAMLKVKVENPVTWLLEVTTNDRSQDESTPN